MNHAQRLTRLAASLEAPLLVQIRGDLTVDPSSSEASVVPHAVTHARDPVLVAGAAADDIGLQCGGWTVGWQGGTGRTTTGTTLVERGAQGPSNRHLGLAIPDVPADQPIHGLVEHHIREHGLDGLLLVGIHTRGVPLAERLAEEIERMEGRKPPRGAIDITFYRDDLHTIGPQPRVGETNIPGDITGRTIILVDDVLHTGRTIRAAMNELFDYGRPASITLVCLIERSGRELPLQADIVGQHVNLNKGEHIKFNGPEPLAFEIQQINDKNISNG